MIVQTFAPEGMPRPTAGHGHVLLEAIWRYFGTYHRWPTFDDIDRELFEGGLQFEVVVQQLCPALLRGLGPDISQLPQGMQELSLTIAGAANCTGAGPAIAVFLGMVRTAASLEPSWRPADRKEQPWMVPGDLANLPGVDPKLLTKEVQFAAAALGQTEPCFRGGSSNPQQLDWSLNFDRTIRPFAGVDRLKDYWRIREQMLGPTRTESDNRPFAKGPTMNEYTVVLPAPVAMPLAPVPPAAGSPETMSVTCNLHPLIAKVAAERFNSGLYVDAVARAFQAVEYRVQTLAGVNEIGERLMGIAFGAKPGPPKLTVTRSTGGSLESEQNGMQFLFKGATGALRNPRMHGPDEKDARDEAEEMLVFASFLMRRLDIEDDKRKAAASGP
ncbi:MULTISPECIES: TIGR02391 family protein [unclassified Streptomyces]|uniref:TIGR02391 family protein n=1 Tax=unclassified Streptomyces TaxID=2593676 RepID=UPI002E821CC7|nr:TIGR02391 family protein [Streptomyces sp. NBC_00589]WTI37474.1 TIGR02391 family protein [Streptomyces sp. NBC_00775]WUB28848.1 TIGR02391 family protein [Streptomyces sp. NBC_00589]